MDIKEFEGVLEEATKGLKSELADAKEKATNQTKSKYRLGSPTKWTKADILGPLFSGIQAILPRQSAY